MNAITLTVKDLKRLLSDRRALVINLVLPLLLTFIMGLSFGGGFFGKSSGISAIPVAMVAGDLPDMVKDPLANGLTESGFFTVVWADTSTARALVKNGDVAAAVVVPPDFTERFFSQEDVALQIWKDPGSQLKSGIVEQIFTRLLVQYQAGEAAYLALWPETLDPQEGTNFQEWADDFFEGDFGDIWQKLRAPESEPELNLAAENFMLAMDRQVALNQALSSQGISLAVKNKSDLAMDDSEAKEINLFNFFLPNFAVFFLMFGVAASSRDFHREQKAGTLQRQMLAPIRRESFLLGKWATASIQGILMLSVLFLAGGILFRVDLAAAPFSLALIVILCSTAAASVFLFLALLSPTEKFMDNLTTVVILVSAMVGGNMIPLENLPAWMKGIGQFGFNFWANLGFQNIMNYGRGVVEDPQPAVVLACMSVGLLMVNLMMFRLRMRKGGLV